MVAGLSTIYEAMSNVRNWPHSDQRHRVDA
jgi:hypothetical protein